MTSVSGTSGEVRNHRRSHAGLYILSLLLLVAVVFGAYSFHAWRDALTSNPAIAQNDLIRSVDNIAVTPSGTPQVATVKDAAKLTSSILAHVAQDGDVLLIYDKADRIIVYRPATHKIVDMLSVESSSTHAH